MMRDEGATKYQKKFRKALKQNEGVSHGRRLNLCLGNSTRTLPRGCVISSQNEK